MASDASEHAVRKPAAGANSTWQSVNTVFSNDKAGMQHVDKDHVKKVIFDMSKDSPHYLEQQRKETKIQAKISKMKQVAGQLTEADLERTRTECDALLTQLEASRYTSTMWLHCDMDAFFAAIEELHDPSLKTKPVAVGGMSMISTANYVARTFGVRSAMPGFIARKLCPHLVFVRGDYKKYEAAAEGVRGVLAAFNPDYIARGLDEATLEISEYCASAGVSPAQAAAEIRLKVQQVTGLTCSIGIANNQMLAKICSDINKPNGQFEIGSSRTEVLEFLRTLPVRKVPGIGKVAEQMLTAFNVHTVQDIHTHRALLAHVFSPITTQFFMRVSLGIGDTRTPDPPALGELHRKGMSNETTFTAISNSSDLESKLANLASKLSESMRSEGLAGKNVTLKLKESTFKMRTRAITLPTYINSQNEIYSAAHRLLLAELPITLRLMGVRISHFRPPSSCPPGQRTLSQFVHPTTTDSTPPPHPPPTLTQPSLISCSVHRDRRPSRQCTQSISVPPRPALPAPCPSVCTYTDRAEQNSAAVSPVETVHAWRDTPPSPCSGVLGQQDTVGVDPLKGGGVASSCSLQGWANRSQSVHGSCPEVGSRDDYAHPSVQCSVSAEQKICAEEESTVDLVTQAVGMELTSAQSTVFSQLGDSAEVLCRTTGSAVLAEAHCSQTEGGSMRCVAATGASAMTDIDALCVDNSDGVSCMERVCETCGASVEVTHWQQHTDWHLACQLSSAVNGPGYMDSKPGRARADTSNLDASVMQGPRIGKRKLGPLSGEGVSRGNDNKGCGSRRSWEKFGFKKQRSPPT